MGTPEHKTSANVEASWTLNNYWLSLYYHESKTAINAHPVAVRVFWGWDEQLKRFASGSVDGDVRRAPGWGLGLRLPSGASSYTRGG